MGENSEIAHGCDASLHFPCAHRYLALVRETTLELCEEMGLHEFKAAQLEMAVDEACANIIEHSYGGACPAEAEAEHPGFTISFTKGRDALVVEIHDRGRGFDFSEAGIVTPDEYVASRSQRGLGLYIISKFVDEFTYTRDAASGNTMRLTKRI